MGIIYFIIQLQRSGQYREDNTRRFDAREKTITL